MKLRGKEFERPRITKETQRNARRWVKALRSGRYKQARGSFLDQTDDGGLMHCCLAVLEDEMRPGENVECLIASDLGSSKVWDKLGMTENLARVLALLNDGEKFQDKEKIRIGPRPWTYEQIAKKIEQLWKLKE